MNMAGQIAQQCKEDVDTQIDSATRNKEHPEWGNEDLDRWSMYIEARDYSDDYDEER